MTQIAITILSNERWTTRPAHQIIISRKETGFSHLQSLLLITYADGFASQATFSRLLDRCFLYRTMVELGLILPRDTTITAQNTTLVGPGYTSTLVSVTYLLSCKHLSPTRRHSPLHDICPRLHGQRRFCAHAGPSSIALHPRYQRPQSRD